MTKPLIQLLAERCRMTLHAGVELTPEHMSTYATAKLLFELCAWHDEQAACDHDGVPASECARCEQAAAKSPAACICSRPYGGEHEHGCPAAPLAPPLATMPADYDVVPQAKRTPLCACHGDHDGCESNCDYDMCGCPAALLRERDASAARVKELEATQAGIVVSVCRWRDKYHRARREVRRLNAALRVAGLVASNQAHRIRALQTLYETGGRPDRVAQLEADLAACRAELEAVKGEREQMREFAKGIRCFTCGSTDKTAESFCSNVWHLTEAELEALRRPVADGGAGLPADLGNLRNMSLRACGTYDLALRDALLASADHLEQFIKEHTK